MKTAVWKYILEKSLEIGTKVHLKEWLNEKCKHGSISLKNRWKLEIGTTSEFGLCDRSGRMGGKLLKIAGNWDKSPTKRKECSESSRMRLYFHQTLETSLVTNLWKHLW